MSVSISVSPVVFPELSLTSHNLSTVLDSMEDGLWGVFSSYVNIPQSEVERIGSKYSSNKECKQAAIDYLISSHPTPSWRLVANALYQIVIHLYYDSPHRALAHLQQLFPTGTCCSFYVYTRSVLYIQYGSDVRYNENIHLERNVFPSSCTPVNCKRSRAKPARRESVPLQL